MVGLEYLLWVGIRNAIVIDKLDSIGANNVASAGASSCVSDRARTVHISVTSSHLGDIFCHPWRSNLSSLGSLPMQVTNSDTHIGI